MAKSKDAAGDEDGTRSGLMGKLKLVMLVLPTVLLIIGALYVFVLAPTPITASAGHAPAGSQENHSGGHPEPTPTEEPGATVDVEPVTINLAGGHFLKVGLLLQATKDAGEEVPAGKAADALIAEFSGKTVDDLATERGRVEAKERLLKVIKKIYEKKVYEIYYTSFVMN